jgi:hypothetical protein
MRAAAAIWYCGIPEPRKLRTVISEVGSILVAKILPELCALTDRITAGIASHPICARLMTQLRHGSPLSTARRGSKKEIRLPH